MHSIGSEAQPCPGPCPGHVPAPKVEQERVHEDEFLVDLCTSACTVCGGTGRGGHCTVCEGSGVLSQISGSAWQTVHGLFERVVHGGAALLRVRLESFRSKR
jgi:hypothetical protein